MSRPVWGAVTAALVALSLAVNGPDLLQRLVCFAFAMLAGFIFATRVLP